jgi:hypothetical protein
MALGSPAEQERPDQPRHDAHQAVDSPVGAVTDKTPTRHGSAAPVASSTDVYPVLGGNWRATCDCGLTISIDTQRAGWTWIVDHACAQS